MKRTELMQELRGLSENELRARAVKVSEEMMKLRFRNATGQLNKPHMLRELRKELARVKTVIRQRRIAESRQNQVEE